MSQAGEIITFQVGNYANFVGAHYFNLQHPELHPEFAETFNLKALWREGRNSQRQTVYTPRVLMFDIKDKWTDNFIHRCGGFSEPQGLAGAARSTLDQVQETISWDGNVQRIVLGSNDATGSDEDTSRQSLSAESRTRSNTKTNVEMTDANNWGDYTKWKLHTTDKFAFRIPNFMYNTESVELVSYGQGLDVYNRLEEDVVDGIRIYAEDCDYLEGFHLLVDEYDGFSGIGAGILEHIGDEYNKKACLGLGLNKPVIYGEKEPTIKDYRIRMSNTAHLWGACNRHARVFTSFGVCEDIFCLNPVAKTFPGLSYDCNSPFISSGILAAALDSLTGPYRLTVPSFPLHEMTSLLNAFGHKMTMIGSSFPFPTHHQSLFKTLSDNGLTSVHSLMSNVNIDFNESLGNIFVIRGIDRDRVISPSESKEYKHVDIRTVTDCLEMYCGESFPKSVHVIKDISTSFKSTYPFPRLYEESVLAAHANKISHSDTWMIPAIASAHNSYSVGQILEKIVEVSGGGVGGSNTKMKPFYEASSFTCNSSAIEFEDYIETINELDSLKETYSSKSS